MNNYAHVITIIQSTFFNMSSIIEDATLFMNAVSCMRNDRFYSSNKSMIKGPPGVSSYKGVCKTKKDNRWRTVIYTNGVQKYLGIFDNEEDAARRYDEESFKLFGYNGHINLK